MGGVLAMSREAQATNGERAEVHRAQDNLKVESGQFYGSRKTQVVANGERAGVVRREDNLRMEGKLETRKQQSAHLKGEKAEIHRHADNLKVEGEFTGKSTELKAHERGERASVVRHSDNLKMEGSMAQRSKSTVGVGQRAATVRHEDHLRLEGKMEGRQVGTAAAKGERFGVIRREDNLKVEGGKFEGRSQSSAAHTSSQQQNGTTGTRARSNTGSTIVLGDENAGTIKRTTKTTSSATSKTAASTSMKATESNLVLAGGVASAGDGSISAVNRYCTHFSNIL